MVVTPPRSPASSDASHQAINGPKALHSCSCTWSHCATVMPDLPFEKIDGDPRQPHRDERHEERDRDHRREQGYRIADGSDKGVVSHAWDNAPKQKSQMIGNLPII